MVSEVMVAAAMMGEVWVAMVWALAAAMLGEVLVAVIWMEGVNPRRLERTHFFSSDYYHCFLL